MILELFNVMHAGRSVQMHLPAVQLSAFFVGLGDPMSAVLTFIVIPLKDPDPHVLPCS